MLAFRERCLLLAIMLLELLSGIMTMKRLLLRIRVRTIRMLELIAHSDGGVL